MLATDPWSSKRLYESEKMREVWKEIVAPQLEEEMISVLKPFGLEQFIALCENRKCGILRYGSNPGIDDAPLHIVKGHNRIWRGNIKESIPLLEQALSGYMDYSHLMEYSYERITDPLRIQEGCYP